MVEEKKNEALEAEGEYRTAVEEAYDYVENFDILETITNVGNDEVFTPRKTADMMLDSLPEEVWHNPNYKWLNPATKNGIFEREIAIRLDKGLEEVIPDVEARRKHILQNIIFSIGQTRFTANVARRTVYYCSQANRQCDGIKAPDGHYVNGYAIGNGTWFNDEEGNIKTPCTDHEFVDSGGRPMPSTCEGDNRKKYKCKYCGISGASEYNDKNQREKYAYELIHVNHLVLERHMRNRFFGGNKDMKFDIIIGNPPYQLATQSTNEAQATPIYNKFVEQAIKLNPKYLCMIIPSRWMNGGFGLNDFRMLMLKDKHIEILHDFMNSTDCFPTVSIAGGVCYFLRNATYQGDCTIYTHHDDGRIVKSKRPLLEEGMDTFIRIPESISILKKVKKLKEKSFYDLVSQRDPYGLNYYETDDSGKRVERVFKKYEQVKKEGDVVIYVQNWYKTGKSYTSPKYITTNKESVAKYKVFISKANGAASSKAPYAVLSSPFVGEPNSICGMTYLMIGPFNSEEIANNVADYIKTKFFRFLVSLMKNTQGAYRQVYTYVPVQDFTKKWTDKELYSKYELTDKEIKFIEDLIKPMSDCTGADDDE